MIFVFLVLGSLFGSFLAWDINDTFPFSIEEVFLFLKLSWLGLPMGFVIWLFYYSNIKKVNKR
jgi:hypothetical protein